MNPFTIGEYLYVHFGSRQRWQVAALSNERCALRFPGLTRPATLWFAVADLLRWNPERQPKAAPVPLLPAPRLEPHAVYVPLWASEHELAPGDVLPGQGGRRFMICTIRRDETFRYPVRAQWLDTGEQFDTVLYPGHGKQQVVGGPKHTAVAANPALVWRSPADKWHWTAVAS